MSKSAFCGEISELPGVFVDNFENPDCKKARAYFLSHCHSDHTQGLYSTALISSLETTGACIYMSQPSAAIVEDECTDLRILKYVRPLECGVRDHTITLPTTAEHEELHITVNLVPASHSFGSVMFLFQANRKTILFTGDFRMPQNDLSKYAQFHNNNGFDPIKIDALYVDTTFIGHKYQHFPKRSESIQATVELIRRHLEGDSNRVALHTSAKYGYESVFNDIYSSLDIKVYVGDDRWKFYSKLQHLVPGVTNEEKSTRIHLCRNYTDKKDHTKCMKTEQTGLNYLYIHFSAMKWGHYDIDDNMINKISDQRMDVCFATHCSRSELMYFVKYLSPKKIVGFPEPFPEVEEKKEYFNLAPRKRKSNEVVNNKVEKRIDKELVRKIFEF